MNWAGSWYNAYLYQTVLTIDKPIELWFAKKKMLTKLSVYHKKLNSLNERLNTQMQCMYTNFYILKSHVVHNEIWPYWNSKGCMFDSNHRPSTSCPGRRASCHTWSPSTPWNCSSPPLGAVSWLCCSLRSWYPASWFRTWRKASRQTAFGTVSSW